MPLGNCVQKTGTVEAINEILPLIFHSYLIWIQFCTTVYYPILSSMKTDEISTVFYVGHK